ncbi:MAG: hypothetical protein ATN33_03780 [Epulopiscium sp. Nele67-Bin001]|nr:MAG: hypothetical protein ATN33_03780 [Epulopiscium sp. Nele67-Bin001]
MKISQAIEAFLISLKFSQLSHNTIIAYKKDLVQWNVLIETNELDTLTYLDFQKYAMKISMEGFKPSTLKRKNTVICKFLKFCHAKKLCQEPLQHLLDPVKARKTNAPKNVLSPQEIKDIFIYIDLEQVCCTPYKHYSLIRNKLIIAILLFTGCRAQEVVSIQKKAVDLENKTILLITKGNKYNNVPIHPSLMEAFKLYYEALEEVDDFDVYSLIKTSPYLFPSKRNPDKHINKRTLHAFFQHLSTKLNRPLHAHLFRHTFASYCIAANMDISTLSTIISHSNPSITLSIYTHEISASQKKKEIQKLTFDI